jgi:molybdenum cofactor biosynthesis protein MoaC
VFWGQIAFNSPSYQHHNSFLRGFHNGSSSSLHHAKIGRKSPLTHVDEQGLPSMVDVSKKEVTRRVATACGRIFLPTAAFNLISDRESNHLIKAGDVTPLTQLERAKQKAQAKGDVLTVAQLAGIMAAKRTADLIPLCHPLPLTHIAVVLALEPQVAGKDLPAIRVEATISCSGRTGVEMEALTAASVALLTVWDMLKAVAGREMIISDLVIAQKSGGSSGDFVRAEVE